MIYFVYITTNLINEKQYIGDHLTNNLEKDVYIGSGTYFNKAVKKYGKENFKREILEFFNSKEDAFNAQEKYIKKYNTLSPNGYNLSPKGGLRISGCHSKETLQKISESNKGKHNKPLSNEHRKKLSLIGKGRKQSEEHVAKKAKSRKGKLFSEESKRRKSESMKGKTPWNKGMPSSEESKEKNRQKHLGKKLSDKQKEKISNSLKLTLKNKK